MKTPEQLEQLQRDCTNLYADHVEVEQDDTGCLVFTFYDDGDEAASLRLSPWGEGSVGNAPDIHPELWRYELDGWEGEPPIGMLCTHFIVGMGSY